MGQKVNPHGLRVGVIKNWDSRWFANKSTFGDTLVEDYRMSMSNMLTEKSTSSAFPPTPLTLSQSMPWHSF